ncbi:MAG: hypothetical protein NXI24_08845 [bacterium]|nr:hypothetical protein [bacterium]
MDQIFEIHAANVDTREILDSIEVRLAERGYDPIDVERVRRLSFTPVPPAREYGFDPAAVTELFERPVSAPDFNSPKFARFRGPLKWLARVLFRFFSNLHDKLNQNKIQAFYNVVHELIAISYRHDRLVDRVEQLQRENQSLRALHEAGSAADESAAGNADTDTDILPLPTVAPVFDQLNREAAAGVVRLNPDAGTKSPIYVLDDHDGSLSRELTRSGLRQLRINVSDPAGFLQLHRNLQSVKRISPDLLLAEAEDGAVGAVMIPDLGRFTVDPDALPELIHRKLASEGLLYIRLQRGRSDAPFTPVLRCDADPVALRRLIEAIGFRVIEEARPVGLREGSFELLAQKIG